MLLALLNILKEKKKRYLIKINRRLASQKSVPKESNERCGAVLQMCVNDLKSPSVPWRRVFSPAASGLNPFLPDLREYNTTLPFFTEVVNPSLSTEPVVTFSEGDARQDNTDVPRGPPVVSSSPVIRPKAKQAPGVEAENIVDKEVHYTTEELNEFANSSRSLRNLCRNRF